MTLIMQKDVERLELMAYMAVCKTLIFLEFLSAVEDA